MKRLHIFCLLISLLLVTTIVACRKQTTKSVIDEGIPYTTFESPQQLDALIERMGNARIVLLGEASHGTHEYYQWRAEITKRLIQEKGFRLMAVEGEWADSYRVNQFIKGGPQDSTSAVNMLRQYDRWPTWMWANYEIASLVTWLNRYNQTQAANKKFGFYGLDVYCLWESMTELMPYIQNAPDSIKQAAAQVRQCFQPFSADPTDYAYAVANASSNCRIQTERLYNMIMNYTGNKTGTTEAEFAMQQNALVALNGERYYRAMVSGGAASWNIRDRHMMQTLQQLVDFHGPDAKVIVWEHNTHVGDARYTDMAGDGMVNVGQLARETYGENNVFILGFGSYAGSVIAAESWGAPMRNMNVPQAINGSWEQVLHTVGPGNKLLFSDALQKNNALQSPIGHRAIGVVYNPNNERGNYVPSIIPKRYDAFMFFDVTSALRPIPVNARNEPPDTYPSGY